MTHEESILLTQIIIATGTGLLAIAAIFGGSISRWWRKPVLSVELNPRPPVCQKIPMGYRGPGNYVTDSYYFRLIVRNEGKTSARQVEVFVKGLDKKRKDGSYEPVPLFLPMNLRWAHIGEMFYPAIHPDTGKFCDLFHIIDPTKRPGIPLEDDTRPGLDKDKGILSFDTITKANTMGHLQPPGDYRLTLIVAGENADAKTTILNVVYDGQWIVDESRMLSEAIGISLAK